AWVPIELEALVPWMPTAGAEVPIQRVPSGLPGPAGIGPRPFAQGELGGNQVGLSCLVMMLNWPRGVGKLAIPVATGKVRTTRSTPVAFEASTARRRARSTRSASGTFTGRAGWLRPKVSAAWIARSRSAL